jgi:hypothetical protein
LSVFRGAWFEPGVPTAPRGTPGTSLVSGGSADVDATVGSVNANLLIQRIAFQVTTLAKLKLERGGRGRLGPVTRKAWLTRK